MLRRQVNKQNKYLFAAFSPIMNMDELFELGEEAGLGGQLLDLGLPGQRPAESFGASVFTPNPPPLPPPSWASDDTEEEMRWGEEPSRRIDH